MKSVILFAFITIFANFMWCGRDYDDKVPSLIVDGYWHVSEIHTKAFSRGNQFLNETQETFKIGEKAIEFGQDFYAEYEFGKPPRRGSSTPYSGIMIFMVDGDTIFMNIQKLNDQNLILENVERNNTGYKIKVITAER